MDDSITISGLDQLFWAYSPSYETVQHFTVSFDVHGGATTFVAHIVGAPKVGEGLDWFLYLYDGKGHAVPGAVGDQYDDVESALMAALATVHSMAYPGLTPEERGFEKGREAVASGSSTPAPASGSPFQG